tara:strand:+ start:161 stop:445 length:285 start_codon:yes stop_codon:yes gene_type:complete
VTQAIAAISSDGHQDCAAGYERCGSESGALKRSTAEKNANHHRDLTKRCHLPGLRALHGVENQQVGTALTDSDRYASPSRSPNSARRETHASRC